MASTSKPPIPQAPGPIEVIRFPAPVPYAQGMQAQIARRNAVERGQAGPALFLLEHTPVITLGRSADRSHLLRSEQELAAMGIEVFETDRGGDVTCHCPGQLVAYPILDLNQWRLSIRGYFRSLEEVVLRLLAQYGLRGERVERYTGVWVEGAKVAAIGIAIHRWVTYHGVAVNVDPDLSLFSYIVPCGIADKPVTSFRRLLASPVPMQMVMDDFVTGFRAVLG